LIKRLSPESFPPNGRKKPSVFKRDLVAMLTPPVHMENAGRFADVITIFDDHTITVEKQRRSGLGIALSKQATSFDWGDWGRHRIGVHGSQ
jgi:hypothetical protein